MPIKDTEIEPINVINTTVIIISSSPNSSWVYSTFELMKKGVDVKVIQLDSVSFGTRFTTLNNNQLLNELGIPTVLFSSEDKLEDVLVPEYYSPTVSLSGK